MFSCRCGREFESYEDLHGHPCYKMFVRTVCYVCHGEGKKKCPQCMAVRYCSPECQKEDWESHKRVCQAFDTKSARYNCKLSNPWIANNIVQYASDYKSNVYIVTLKEDCLMESIYDLFDNIDHIRTEWRWTVAFGESNMHHVLFVYKDEKVPPPYLSYPMFIPKSRDKISDISALIKRDADSCVICTKLKTSACAKCGTNYCSTVCQRLHWEDHKLVCPRPVCRDCKLLHPDTLKIKGSEKSTEIQILNTRPNKVGLRMTSNPEIQRFITGNEAVLSAANLLDSIGTVSPMCKIIIFYIVSNDLAKLWKDVELEFWSDVEPSLLESFPKLKCTPFYTFIFCTEGSYSIHESLTIRCG